MKKHQTNHHTKAVIFDLAWTLYDPLEKKPYPDTLVVLERLSVRADLYLVTRDGESRKFLSDIGIYSFFKKVFFVERKTMKLFLSIAGHRKKKYEEVFVVGDTVWEEITVGNKLGYKTVLVRQGAYAGVVPKEEWEIPWKVVTGIGEIAGLVQN